MVAFNNTDVDVSAKVMVDGKTYPDVGIHFRGSSSFGVGNGYKRSLNLSFDFVNKEQAIGGYRTLELLNSNDDPTFMRYVLYAEISRDYLPAPKANLVRVVINGENWGIYQNVQSFNKDFVNDSFSTTKGARWKVQGSPNGRGTMAFLGEDSASYKNVYRIKSKDDPKDWTDLIKLFKTLNQTAPAQLEQSLAPMLDIDGALKFLAIDNTLINNDGYWIRTSDYNIYKDTKGRFHLLMHDGNETFLRPGGPGFGGGMAGVQLDPLIAVNDPNKPLASKLLAVPALRMRYLGFVRDIAQRWLDWSKLGPVVERNASLIAADVEKDTHKLYSIAEFKAGVSSANSSGNAGGGTISLKDFADQRRAYLLDYTARTQ